MRVLYLVLSFFHYKFNKQKALERLQKEYDKKEKSFEESERSIKKTMEDARNAFSCDYYFLAKILSLVSVMKLQIIKWKGKFLKKNTALQKKLLEEILEEIKEEEEEEIT